MMRSMPPEQLAAMSQQAGFNMPGVDAASLAEMQRHMASLSPQQLELMSRITALNVSSPEALQQDPTAMAQAAQVWNGWTWHLLWHDASRQCQGLLAIRATSAIRRRWKGEVRLTLMLHCSVYQAKYWVAMWHDIQTAARCRCGSRAITGCAFPPRRTWALCLPHTILVLCDPVTLSSRLQDWASVYHNCRSSMDLAP